MSSRRVVDIWHNDVEITIWPPAQSTYDGWLLPSGSAALPDSRPPKANNGDQPHSDTAALPALTAQKLNVSDELPLEKFYIHRKGAAPTHHPSSSKPLTILPLPGSRATPTLILHLAFTPHNTYGQKNALSLAHGAGRALSRAKDVTYIAEKYAGRADDLLRGDFVKADKRGKQDRGR